jgi:acetyltransferase-like isoleucine patch superfamily enzyme
VSSTPETMHRIMPAPVSRTFADPLSLATHLANKFRSLWMRWTYPFASVGREFRAHYTCDFRRSIAPYVKIGDSVLLDRDVWVNIPVLPNTNEPVIMFEDDCTVGRRCMISARNRIHFEKNVVLAASVLVMDHNHAFEDVNIPIKSQGITPGGTIRIEQGCRIGFGAAIICGKGELVIGRNSVIGPNSVVSRSVPPNSVVAGNPGQIVNDPLPEVVIVEGLTGDRLSRMS